MKRANRCVRILLVGFLVASCASFDTKLQFQDVLKTRQPTVRETQSGLEVSVEEFVSSEKSRKAFDADLASHGVLALLLRVENKSEGNYKVEDKEAKGLLGNRVLPLLSGVDAATQAATSEYAGKALGWTLATGPFALIFWPITVSVSGLHTGEVNRRIEQHFETLGFGRAIVKLGQTAAGFLYFKLPEVLNRQETIIVEIVAHETQSGKQIIFNLPIPNLSLFRKN